MKEILYISVSPQGPASVSDRFGQEVLTRLCQQHPSAMVHHRNLADAPPPFVDAAFCAAIMSAGGHAATFSASDGLIEEVERADAMIIATPMHNYTVPATLKAWVDQIVRIHRTFRSTPSGKVGMLEDRPVFIVVASGGWFTGPSPNGTPPQPDFLTPYLRAVLNTIGLMTIHVLTLEGVTRSPDILRQSLTEARAALDRIVPTITARPAAPRGDSFGDQIFRRR